MAADEEVHEGASTKELLIEACRRNNTDLLQEIIDGILPDEDRLSKLLNETTTVLGNHLYHEAASQGNYEIIDLLLDQPNFECDPISRREGDTPLHAAIRWINAEPPANREFGNALVDMMLEAGSNPRTKNKGGLSAFHLVDPANDALRQLIRKHEYAALNAGDFVNVEQAPSKKPPLPSSAAPGAPVAQPDDDDDDDAEFSGSDDEERAEWERRRNARRG